MKLLAFTLFLSMSGAFNLFAQSDSLVIKFKNNQIEKIPISSIQSIKFENLTSVDDAVISNSSISMLTNYPNPFSENTSMEFEISNSGVVKILIYDISGNQIQELTLDNCITGKNIVQWNCLDKNHKRVENGMYFYEIRYKNETLTKKMIVIK